MWVEYTLPLECALLDRCLKKLDLIVLLEFIAKREGKIEICDLGFESWRRDEGRTSSFPRSIQSCSHRNLSGEVTVHFYTCRSHVEMSAA